jgi:hypothetical protein
VFDEFVPPTSTKRGSREGGVVLLSKGFVPYSDRGTNRVDNKCEKERERERKRVRVWCNQYPYCVTHLLLCLYPSPELLAQHARNRGLYINPRTSRRNTSRQSHTGVCVCARAHICFCHSLYTHTHTHNHSIHTLSLSLSVCLSHSLSLSLSLTHTHTLAACSSWFF